MINMVWVMIVVLFLVDVFFLVMILKTMKVVRAVLSYAQGVAKTANAHADMLENLIREKDVDDDR